MVKMLRSIFTYVGWAELHISILLMVSIVSIMFFQIVSRFFFKRPHIWPEELAIMMMIWLIFIGASYVYKEKKHLRVTFFLDRLPKTVGLIISIANTVLVCLFLYFVIRAALILIPIQSNNLTPSLRLSSGLYTLPIIIAAASMLSYSIFDIFCSLNKNTRYR